MPVPTTTYNSSICFASLKDDKSLKNGPQVAKGLLVLQILDIVDKCLCLIIFFDVVIY